MNRNYCENCGYPTKTCVCAGIEQLVLPIRVIILQHNKESKHAKNTARLAKLVSPSIELINLSDKVLLKQLTKSIETEKVLVLYPNDTSVALEGFSTNFINNVPETKAIAETFTLLLIDASWSQAYAIWQQQAWLRELTHCHFTNLPDKQYVIRKSKKAHQLSTIEALAHSVEILCGISGKAYLNLFNYMQEYWIAHTNK